MLSYLPVIAVTVVGLAVLAVPFVAGAQLSRRRTPDLTVPLVVTTPNDDADFANFAADVKPFTPAPTRVEDERLIAAPTAAPVEPVAHVVTPAALDAEAARFFAEDPLYALSVPDQLELSVIADQVLLDHIRSGALPPDRVFPVSAAWIPWGYDLADTESAPSTHADVAEDRSLLELTLELDFPEPELATQGG